MGRRRDRLQSALEAPHGAVKIVLDLPISIWELSQSERQVSRGQPFERVRQLVGDQFLFRGGLCTRRLGVALRFDRVIDNGRGRAKLTLQPTIKNAPVIDIPAD